MLLLFLSSTTVVVVGRLGRSRMQSLLFYARSRDDIHRAARDRYGRVCVCMCNDSVCIRVRKRRLGR